MDENYILIAEDDEDDRYLLNSAFKDVPGEARLVFVTNGIELLDHFKKIEDGSLKRLPSLLIVDLNMPKKTGREAISDLSKKDYFKKFPTVIFSTTGNETEKERCNALGIDDFFVKPSHYSALINIVNEFRSLSHPFKGTSQVSP